MSKHNYKLLLLLLTAGTLRAQTYSYTGAVQTFTVPACVTTITVDMVGASGGNGSTSSGGLGGRVQATLPVIPGEVLQIFVGEVGANNQGSHPGVYNGGGGVYSYSSGGTAGTGGGGTDIRRTPYAVADRIAVAGGGGGGGYQGGNGGNGGGLVGIDGVPFPSWPNSGGKGGTQSAGGQQGVACCSCPTYTQPGSFGAGGNGAGDGAGGGGGGGGYYGGGGSCFAGGGGGSSYAEPLATGVTHTTGYQSGNGQVVITFTPSGAIPASPTAVAGSTSVCEGSTATYSINPVGGATSYTWSVPVGSTINSGQGTTSISVTFGSASGNVSVTADNSCGSSAPTTSAITILALPTVALGPDVTACAGATLDAGNPGATYLWSEGTTTQTLFVNMSGPYTVTVTAANGCTGTDAINVIVNTPPVAALGADITQCGGTATLDPQVSGLTYLWSDASTNQTLVASSSGVYAVTVTDANGCTDSDTISVTINTIPAAAGSAANMLPCLADAPVALTGTPSGGTWSGTAVTGNSFDPATAGVGTHVLVYTYVDSLTTCSDTAQINITVDICLGIQNTVASNVTVFPNPVTNVLQVQSTSVLTGYTVMDINGREVMKGNFSGNSQNKIDVSVLPVGTYVLRTLDNSGSVRNVQFVKE
jgi:hypothetical protein